MGELGRGLGDGDGEGEGGTEVNGEGVADGAADGLGEGETERGGDAVAGDGVGDERRGVFRRRGVACSRLNGIPDAETPGPGGRDMDESPKNLGDPRQYH